MRTVAVTPASPTKLTDDELFNVPIRLRSGASFIYAAWEADEPDRFDKDTMFWFRVGCSVNPFYVLRELREWHPRLHLAVSYVCNDAIDQIHREIHARLETHLLPQDPSLDEPAWYWSTLPYIIEQFEAVAMGFKPQLNVAPLTDEDEIPYA